MITKIKKKNELDWTRSLEKSYKKYNPNALDHTLEHRMKSIEITDEYTRIDFIFRSSMVYDNGGWIQMEQNAYIKPVGSTTKYRLLTTIGIPISPEKHYFKKQGEYYTYSLIFSALPANTKSIDIIEKEAPDSYFNFYNVDYSKWMKVLHPMDVPRSKN